MTILEFEQDPMMVMSTVERLDRWLVNRNVLAHTFGDSPEKTPTLYTWLLRDEIREWLKDRYAIYRLYKDRITREHLNYTGFFIEFEDDTLAVEFKLRWFG
jgi:IS1 family transposase